MVWVSTLRTSEQAQREDINVNMDEAAFESVSCGSHDEISACSVAENSDREEDFNDKDPVRIEAESGHSGCDDYKSVSCHSDVGQQSLSQQSVEDKVGLGEECSTIIANDFRFAGNGQDVEKQQSSSFLSVSSSHEDIRAVMVSALTSHMSTST